VDLSPTRAASGKFEWLSPGLIMSVLQRLGFEVVHVSNTPRDLLLVASLVNPMAPSSLEHYLRS
jgi:predicted transcriptional regulator